MLSFRRRSYHARYIVGVNPLEIIAYHVYCTRNIPYTFAYRRSSHKQRFYGRPQYPRVRLRSSRAPPNHRRIHPATSVLLQRRNILFLSRRRQNLCCAFLSFPHHPHIWVRLWKSAYPLNDLADITLPARAF